jgi:hypothetical protein
MRAPSGHDGGTEMPQGLLTPQLGRKVVLYRYRPLYLLLPQVRISAAALSTTLKQIARMGF